MKIIKRFFYKNAGLILLIIVTLMIALTGMMIEFDSVVKVQESTNAQLLDEKNAAEQKADSLLKENIALTEQLNKAIEKNK